MKVLFAGRMILILMTVFLLREPAAAQQRTPVRTVESFLYITDAEVRHELLIPLGALESLLPVQTENPQILSIAEQELATQLVPEVLDSLNPVSIDGITVAASGSTIVFFDRAVTEITGIPEKKDLPAGDAIAGVILRYETKGTPQHVAMLWSAFNEVISVIPATLYTDESEEHQVLRPDEPVLEWLHFGAPNQPVLTEVPEPENKGWFGGAPEVSEKEADAIFRALLMNIYRAFDYREESAIYDALGRSVAGEMLAQLYLDIRRGLAIEAEGGPTTRVLDVDVTDGELLSADDDEQLFVYDGTWTVTGSVEHWGHIHTRKNLYRARFDVAVIEGAWKIKGMQVNKQERLETTLGRRGAAPVDAGS